MNFSESSLHRIHRIVFVFFSEIMSSNDNDPQRKRTRSATGAERAKKCRLRNPDKVKLSNLKNRVKMAGKRLSDELYDSSFRERAKQRQRKSREKKGESFFLKTSLLRIFLHLSLGQAEVKQERFPGLHSSLTIG